MAHTIKLVDSIASSPTTRLDLNDGSTWRCSMFAPPPRLRRAMGENAMTDGAFVSSSSYSARVVTLALTLVTSTEDAAATQIQLLARELDRADNYLKYQPDGATKPVFFRMLRSDVAELQDLHGPLVARTFTVELLAEPFALGLRETLGPFTVNNDPAAGSNGCYFDVTGVIGDVPAPAVFAVTSDLPQTGVLAVRQHGTPSGLGFFVQAESATLGADTTNPGGGPDAAMSGAGTNNYVRTSFSGTPTVVDRVTATFAGASVEKVGQYRLVVAIRRSDATSVITVAATVGTRSLDTVTTPLTTQRRLIDLGIIRPDVGPGRVGYGADAPAPAITVALRAARASGTSTLDWDYVALIPADETMLTWDLAGLPAATDVVIDGYAEAVYAVLGTSIFDGTDALSTIYPVSGAFPSLVPGRTNRFYLFTGYGSVVNPTADYEHLKAGSATLSLNYWPAYLSVRPSAT